MVVNNQKFQCLALQTLPVQLVRVLFKCLFESGEFELDDSRFFHGLCRDGSEVLFFSCQVDQKAEQGEDWLAGTHRFKQGGRVQMGRTVQVQPARLDNVPVLKIGRRDTFKDASQKAGYLFWVFSPISRKIIGTFQEK